MTNGETGNRDSTTSSSGQPVLSEYFESAEELRRLRLELVQLRSDLEIANARVEFYEEQVGSIQEIVKAALNYAFDIRQNAEKQARKVVDEADNERKRLQEEVAELSRQKSALISEAAALNEEIARLAAEREQVKAEIADLKESMAAILKQRQQLDAEKERLRNDLHALDQRLQAIKEAFDSVSVLVQSVATDSPEADDEPVDRVAAIQHQPGVVELAPAATEMQSAVNVGQADLAPDVMQETEVGEPPNQPVKRRLDLSDILLTKQSTDVELVVSALHGFPRLVEFERALREFSEIKNFYVRDFRNGVARLVVRLKEPDQRKDLRDRLEQLPGWNLSVTAAEPTKIELRVVD